MYNETEIATVPELPTIEPEGLEALGYTIDTEGWDVEIDGSIGMLFAVCDEDTGIEMDFCYLYSPRKRTGVIVNGMLSELIESFDEAPDDEWESDTGECAA
ncbi:MAG: hypothetical protein ABMA13_05570 [Chthoniobacteraceae bacterium]